MTDDQVLIRDAAILAGLLTAGEVPGRVFAQDLELVLREMRAETETLRLARRIAVRYKIDARDILQVQQ